MATRHQVRQCVVSLLYAQEMGSEMEHFSDEFLEEKKIRKGKRAKGKESRAGRKNRRNSR